ERSLNAYPFLEICKGDLIHYMCPLENQVDFSVPELLEKKTSDDTEKTVEHEDADVTESGAGEPEQKSSPVIQEVVAENRDIVDASAPLLESSQPSLGEEEGQSEDGDQGGKGSSESVGSGSSFEELDMEMEEEKEEKANEAEEEDQNGQQKPMTVGETIGNREE
ncbi:hypothetical protein QQF64_028407, partial [Cirrhinus molitorella]